MGISDFHNRFSNGCSTLPGVVGRQLLSYGTLASHWGGRVGFPFRNALHHEAFGILFPKNWEPSKRERVFYHRRFFVRQGLNGSMSRIVRNLVFLGGALALVWGGLAIPAWGRHGALGLAALAVMAAACFAPGVLLGLFEKRFRGSNAAFQILLMGTALRVGFVLAVSFLLLDAWPELRSTEFFLALSVFYLVALSLETRQLLVVQQELGPVGDEGACQVK